MTAWSGIASYRSKSIEKVKQFFFVPIAIEAPVYRQVLNTRWGLAAGITYNDLYQLIASRDIVQL